MASSTSLDKLDITFTEPHVEFPENLLRDKVIRCFADVPSTQDSHMVAPKSGVEIATKFERRRLYRNDVCTCTTC
jgi:hypothetical protein